MNPKTFTIEDIRSWDPCYDPSKFLKEDWSGTVFDLLYMKDVPFEDRLWVILRTEICSEKLMRLFAVWCARQVQHLMKDERSIHALDVAERYAYGDATSDELNAAQAAAWAAAWAAARDDARDDAQAAAQAAARDDAQAAAQAAAWAAARGAAWEAQKSKLIEMLRAGIQTGDTVLEEL